MVAHRTFVVDPRLPVGAHVSETDPAHPNMVTRNLLLVQNQAVADTKYDILRPKRIAATEGFQMQSVLSSPLVHVVLLAAFLYIALNTRHFAVKVACAFLAILILHRLTSRMEESMLTCLRTAP